MRRLVLVLAALSIVAGVAGPAAASLPGPVKVPNLSDCHEVNRLLGIDNVRDCDNNS